MKESKKPTDNELLTISTEYESIIKHFKELGLINIVDDGAGVKITRLGGKVARAFELLGESNSCPPNN